MSRSRAAKTKVAAGRERRNRGRGNRMRRTLPAGTHLASSASSSLCTRTCSADTKLRRMAVARMRSCMPRTAPSRNGSARCSGICKGRGGVGRHLLWAPQSADRWAVASPDNGEQRGRGSRRQTPQSRASTRARRPQLKDSAGCPQANVAPPPLGLEGLPTHVAWEELERSQRVDDVALSAEQLCDVDPASVVRAPRHSAKAGARVVALVQEGLRRSPQRGMESARGRGQGTTHGSGRRRVATAPGSAADRC